MSKGRFHTPRKHWLQEKPQRKESRRAIAAERRSSDLQATIQLHERQIATSKEKMASLVGDCKWLTLCVISALVNAKDAESQLILAQNDLAAAQSKLTVSKEELATTSHKLAAAKKYAAEKDQQLLNVLAKIKKRKSPNDDIVPPAERVHDEEEMDHQKALAVFEGQNRRFDEIKKQQGGFLNSRQSHEWMPIYKDEQHRLLMRQNMLKERRRLPEG